MAKAGQSLRQVLTEYGISQNRLAVTMGINRSTVHQWVNEISDPLAEAVRGVIKGLHTIDPLAADHFIALYLEKDSESSTSD
jgi:transcriptional regulator with XRE-family HTH domain